MTTLTPDGIRYLALAEHRRLPRPFNLRWLLPRLCRTSHTRWVASTVAGTVLWATGTAALAVQHGATRPQALTAGLLVAGLPSVRYSWLRPILVDLPSLGLAVWAAVALHVGWWPAAIALALVSGCVRETGPVWAAVYAWNPLLLSGLVVVLLRTVVATGPDVNSIEFQAQRYAANPNNATILQHPIRSAIEAHAGRWRDPLLMLAPWGGLTLALFWPSPWLAVALAVGYAQLLVATDSVRLYQASAPVLAVIVAVNVPWLLPLLIAHWFNPFAGDGV